MILTAVVYTNAIFQENQEGYQQIVFPDIMSGYHSDLDSGWYSPKFAVGTFSGGYICVHPVISTAVVTQTQFSRKTRKS